MKKTRIFRIKSLYAFAEFHTIYYFETSHTSNNKKMKYSSTNTQRVNHELRLYIVIVKKNVTSDKNTCQTRSISNNLFSRPNFPGFFPLVSFLIREAIEFHRVYFFHRSPDHIMRKRSTGQ